MPSAYALIAVLMPTTSPYSFTRAVGSKSMQEQSHCVSANAYVRISASVDLPSFRILIMQYYTMLIPEDSGNSKPDVVAIFSTNSSSTIKSYTSNGHTRNS
jgi:hypothetical protein